MSSKVYPQCLFVWVCVCVCWHLCVYVSVWFVSVISKPQCISHECMSLILCVLLRTNRLDPARYILFLGKQLKNYRYTQIFCFLICLSILSVFSYVYLQNKIFLSSLSYKVFLIQKLLVWNVIDGHYYLYSEECTLLTFMYHWH